MPDRQVDEARDAVVVLEKAGRFYVYQPGLGVIVSSDQLSAAYGNFLAARDDYLRNAEQAGLANQATQPASEARPGVSMGRELAIFTVKTCLALLIVMTVIGVGAVVSARAVGGMISRTTSGMEPISLHDVARKAEEVARDIRTMPDESRELLRRSIASISRAVAPLSDAWRKPEDVPEPVRPPPPDRSN